MKIFETNVKDNKEHKVVGFQAIIEDSEVDEIYDRLFSPMTNTKDVADVIIDSLLHNYTKAIVADKFIRTKDIRIDVIYHISVVGKNISFDMMLSKNDKIKEVFY